MVKLKTEADLEKLRISGDILSRLLRLLKEAAAPGRRLADLNEMARDFLMKEKARSAFFQYRSSAAAEPFPGFICTSVNATIVHGRPNRYLLRSGDILKIDAGVDYQDYITDAAITVSIGEISPAAKKLMRVTAEALERAIEVCRPGNYVGDIGYEIEKHANKNNLSVYRGLTGHGVGFALHEDPDIYNYGDKGTGEELKKGMVLAIEPMMGLGNSAIKQIKDDSFVSADGALAAHFEKTVAITNKECEILTNW